MTRSEQSFQNAQRSYDNASDEPRHDENYFERKADAADRQMDIARDDALTENKPNNKMKI